MAERPILFSGPMVRAILEGRKTQTRRVASKINPDYLSLHCERGAEDWEENRMAIETGALSAPLRCPYGAPGDTLWVRETFSFLEANPRGLDLDGVWYWADGPVPGGDWTRPKPSIYMPRWASRLTLLIRSVRVERLQEIDEADARAEGVEPLESEAHEARELTDLSLCGVCGGHREHMTSSGTEADCGRCDTHVQRFRWLWDSINAKSHPWASNPWVWVVEFEREIQQ